MSNRREQQQEALHRAKKYIGEHKEIRNSEANTKIIVDTPGSNAARSQNCSCPAIEDQPSEFNKWWVSFGCRIHSPFGSIENLTPEEWTPRSMI